MHIKNTKCTVRLLSDLHAEGGYDRNLFKSQGEDVLVIAGDLHVGANNVWTMLKQFADHQPNIVYTYGNHEFYRQDYHSTCAKLEEWAKYTGIHILNPGVVYFNPSSKKLSQVATLGSVKFIGAPLWTNFRNDNLSKLHAKTGINDFRLIEFSNRYFSPNDAHYLFDQQFGYIKHEYENNNYKKVIITHFLPCTECIDKKYLGKGQNTLNDYFANDLSSWIETLDDTTWLHGHTHDNVDIIINTTRILANPYGYGKNSNFKEQLINI